MQSLGQVLTSCLELLQTEFAIDGLTFSWKILLWTIVAGAVICLIVKWSDDK